MIFSILRRNFVRSSSRNPWWPEKCAAPSYALYFSTRAERKSSNASAVYERLLQKHGFSPAAASSIAAAVPQWKTPEKCDSVLLYLKEVGFTRKQLEKSFTYLPRLLSANLEKTLMPKIKLFQDRGFSGEVIGAIISTDPRLLHRSASEKLIPRLDILRSLLRSDNEVALVLKKGKWMLSSDLENNLLPNVETLKSCGVSMDQIGTICRYAPRMLLNRPETVRKFVEQVDEMGVSRSSRMFVYSVAAIGSLAEGKWEQKAQALRDIFECTEEDILRFMKHSPLVFVVSEDKMRKVKEIVVGSGKYSVSSIIEWPKSLMYSIEQRYVPRFEVLKILESRLLLQEWPLLQSLCLMPDRVFHNKFVNPHFDEIGEAFLASRVLNAKRDCK